jgi:hypothetical protein
VTQLSPGHCQHNTDHIHDTIILHTYYTNIKTQGKNKKKKHRPITNKEQKTRHNSQTSKHETEDNICKQRTHTKHEREDIGKQGKQCSKHVIKDNKCKQRTEYNKPEREYNKGNQINQYTKHEGEYNRGKQETQFTKHRKTRWRERKREEK